MGQCSKRKDRPVDKKANSGGDFECPICTQILRNPVMTQCGHHYCRGCLEEYRRCNGHPKCPECRQPIVGDVVDAMTCPITRFFRNALMAVTVECGHAGCDWVGIYEDRDEHEKGCTGDGDD